MTTAGTASQFPSLYLDTDDTPRLSGKISLPKNGSGAPNLTKRARSFTRSGAPSQARHRVSSYDGYAPKPKNGSGATDLQSVPIPGHRRRDPGSTPDQIIAAAVLYHDARVIVNQLEAQPKEITDTRAAFARLEDAEDILMEVASQIRLSVLFENEEGDI